MTKIILIEDDEALRKQLLFTLESDHEVSEAGNRLEALDMLKKHMPEIAILDLGLPPNENSPDEGLFIINHICENYSCKVIVLTGQATREAAVKSLEMGCFDYLEKPVNIDQLLFSMDRAKLFIDTENELKSRGVERIDIQVEIGNGLQDIREKAEKNIIIRVLNETGFNVYKSAQILGVKRESLYYFIKKFHLERN
ncbi:two component transcriptional regulator, Fis family [Denitrovibrio acetiphilus DSM 12809]|uniref:Two component transcriptional regulator, Fis family n=1 Tax=Denitrovibrio acetiphilus (strain DSM 12809 / NBRC 114555 / N2460) TaxID=522772 RepID=D4H2T3_DENA2|nr:response regulator [Denitrovibrio acetiphilus]ADD67144.1 two component transcriptional regulator, Fis family [Denitrovibrio acetiphilus DSM 12809]